MICGESLWMLRIHSISAIVEIAIVKVLWYTLLNSTKINNIEGKSHEKTFRAFYSFTFLLSGCSQSKSEEISVNNPYEIAKGTSTLSYYDTENNISVDGFNIVENNLQNFQDKNDNIIVNDDGTIRCITVVNDKVKTFQSISVGDSTEKIEEFFDNEYQNGNNYMVLFAGGTEQDPANPDKEDNWIWITYFINDNKVTSIQIYDVKYGREMK